MSNDGRREPPRTFRVSDELWERAKEVVRERGDGSVSLILREALKCYVREAERRGNPPAANRGANREQRSRLFPPQRRTQA